MIMVNADDAQAEESSDVFYSIPRQTTRSQQEADVEADLEADAGASYDTENEMDTPGANWQIGT